MGNGHAIAGMVSGANIVELVSDRETREAATGLASNVVNELRNRGVLTGAIGPDSNILKLRSPMVFSKDNADYMLQILDETLAALPA